jgi:hypothetical protein
MGVAIGKPNKQQLPHYLSTLLITQKGPFSTKENRYIDGKLYI